MEESGDTINKGVFTANVKCLINDIGILNLWSKFQNELLMILRKDGWDSLKKIR